MSMQDVARHFGVSLNAVVYFMRKQNIPRRDRKSAKAAQFQNKPLSFSVKTNLSNKEQLLKTAAIMLYWAEGSKSDKCSSVDFANSDPEMVRIFMAFLRKVCRVDEKRVRIYLYCYSDQDVDKLKQYWAHVTNVPIDQFTKPYVRSDFKKDGRKMKYGMIHVRYADKKLLNQIKEWIREEVYDIL